MDHLPLSPATLLERMVKRSYVRPLTLVVPSTQPTACTMHFGFSPLCSGGEGGRFGEAADAHTGRHRRGPVRCRERNRLCQRARGKQARDRNGGGAGQHFRRCGEGEHPGGDHGSSHDLERSRRHRADSDQIVFTARSRIPHRVGRRSSDPARHQGSRDRRHGTQGKHLLHLGADRPRCGDCHHLGGK
jgi:hypothetical protein